MTATHLESRLVERFRSEIAEKIANDTAFIAAGSIADLAEYKLRSGQVRGMEAALAILEEHFRKLVDER